MPKCERIEMRPQSPSVMKHADREPVEIYSRATNAWIVRTPGRQYPAMVVQRDSFDRLLALAESIANRARDCADAELEEEADELRELLSNRLAHYVGVLSEYGFHVPIGRRAHSS
jgi:signal transduction histidine kinase